jgi:nucleotide-binding universal stress UspA family protein
MKILVATDGSDPAQHAVNYAAEMAIDKNAELVIVSVVPNLPVTVEDGFSPINHSKLETELEEYTNKQLKSMNEEIKSKYKVKSSIVLKQGIPARHIIETSDEIGADLIIIGNRGAGGLLSWMLGSVSRSVVEACTVPVLVVKDKKFCKK